MKISAEQVFSIPENSFIVSPSESGYTLAYSADGEAFTNYDTPTPANEVLIVNGIPKHTIIKLSGNTSEVYINY